MNIFVFWLLVFCYLAIGIIWVNISEKRCKCKHGVRRGAKKGANGRLICAQCQADAEQRQLAEEQKKQLEGEDNKSVSVHKFVTYREKDDDPKMSWEIAGIKNARDFAIYRSNGAFIEERVTEKSKTPSKKDDINVAKGNERIAEKGSVDKDREIDEARKRLSEIKEKLRADEEAKRSSAMLAEKEKQRKQKIASDYIVDYYNAIIKRNEMLIWEIDEIRNLTHRAFEDLIASLYKRMGYDVVQTPYINDGGKDMIAERNGVSYLIECKHYRKGTKIQRQELQVLFAAMNDASVKRGIYIATCDYSREALVYGKEHNIQTIDYNRLIEMLHQYSNGDTVKKNNYRIVCQRCGERVEFKYLNDVKSKRCPNGHIVQNLFYNNSIPKPICLNCGSALKLVNEGKRGAHYACSRYPSCDNRLSLTDFDKIFGRKHVDPAQTLKEGRGEETFDDIFARWGA